MGWGAFLDKLISWFTPQQRIRRIKDEIDKLKKEEKELLDGEASNKTTARLLVIGRRLHRLNGLLQNST